VHEIAGYTVAALVAFFGQTLATGEAFFFLTAS
jgi:hypothetical protein